MSDNEADNCDTSYFQYLPKELILNIFSYLPKYDLDCRVPLVCKDWKTYASDCLLWTSFDLNDLPELATSLPRICSKIQKYSSNCLHSIYIRGLDCLTADSVVEIVTSCPSLRILDLGFCLINIPILKIISIICSSLMCINLEGSDAVNTQCVKILCQSKTLVEFNFSHCENITDDGINIIADECHGLKSINIDGITGITNRALINLVNKQCNSLKNLVLDGDDITDDVIKAVSECKKLALLRISFCETLSDICLTYITDLPKLKVLRLRKGLEFTTVGIKQLFADTRLSSLTELDLSECESVEDECITHIVSCCPNLSHLSLCWCLLITDVALQEIVTNLRYLRELNLVGDHLVEGQCLVSTSTQLPHLKYLDLEQCNNINDDVIRKVAEELPSLKIREYYGDIVGSDGDDSQLSANFSQYPLDLGRWN